QLCSGCAEVQGGVRSPKEVCTEKVLIKHSDLIRRSTSDGSSLVCEWKTPVAEPWESVYCTGYFVTHFLCSVCCLLCFASVFFFAESRQAAPSRTINYFKQSKNMRHMEGKSQLTHLRCCKIPKNIGRCSLSFMGLCEPVSILRRGRRKARLLEAMGLQLRDIQVLCLVLMVVIEPFLRCAAAAGGMVPRTRMATPAADDDP
ncbi:hypothetical protein DQ04_24971000, partial [Trypanosoma grayi]|uniref:hypothetical protein n=1 Tax=Trypanosoma grayi TaxID=71804 RepID=UPI0004F493D9